MPWAYGAAHGTLNEPKPVQPVPCVLCGVANALVRMKFTDRRICETCRMDVDIAVVYVPEETSTEPAM